MAVTPSSGKSAKWRSHILETQLLPNRVPTLIRVKEFDFLCDLESVRTQILLIDHSVVADDESHYSGDSILRRKSNEREAADHRSLHDIIHLPERRVRSLPLQHSKVITVVGLSRSSGVTAFNGARHIFTNRPVPCAVRILPGEVH